MISKSQDIFLELKKAISKEKKIINEINSLKKNKRPSEQEKEMISPQMESLKESLKSADKEISIALEKIKMTRKLEKPQEVKKEEKTVEKKERKNFIANFFKKLDFRGKKQFTRLEKETVKRHHQKEEEPIKKEKEKKVGWYIKTANRLFAERSEKLAQKEEFRSLKRDLIKSNMQYVPKTYVSIILFSTLASIAISFLLVLFLLFFNVGVKFPIITLVQESLLTRFAKIFWILLLAPVLTFVGAYFYPSLEKKSTESKVDEELPFATIHMAAISGSLVDPTKIFSIIISTNEYPAISREFTKLLNEINLYGHDLVSALRELSFNTPSTRLSELLNGLATTLSSGGNLADFFDKRSESLLFEYKIEREKRTKSAETFMDIYISIVIAAPMILMLLLMMMKISGLGISLSSSMISVIMVLSVTMVNIGFLTFLNLKQTSQ